MTDVKRVAEYIQRFSELIGVPIAPLDKDGFTQVARGSATVGINVVEQKGFILFLAPIMDVPARSREELYRRLLELNYLATEDGAFAVDRESGRDLSARAALARVARLRRVRRHARYRRPRRRRVGRQAQGSVRRLRQPNLSAFCAQRRIQSSSLPSSRGSAPREPIDLSPDLVDQRIELCQDRAVAILSCAPALRAYSGARSRNCAIAASDSSRWYSP